jgi:hypothetical protein
VFFVKGHFVTEIIVEEIHMTMTENIPNGRCIKTGERVIGEESRKRREKWIYEQSVL